MTEAQFIYYAAPLLLFIMAAISIAITSFFYLEFKEKKARFKNFWAQQREIDNLEDKNKETTKKSIK